jgi:hypothetical protein
LSISQYSVNTVDMVQKMMTRERIRYGTPFSVCSNSLWWNQGVFDYQNWTFIANTGEVYNFVGEHTDWVWANGLPHNIIRLQQTWKDTVDEPYWDRVVTNSTAQGAVLSQTFLNSQDGWLVKLNLYFSRVAGSGNIEVLITEVTNGYPDVSKIIGRTTVNVADMKAATPGAPTPTVATFAPTFLGKGRYAIILVTAGNHFVWTTTNGRFAGGSLFYSTDGAASHQVELLKDMCFEVFFAQFRQNYTEVQLGALTLVGGIAAIDINARSFTPSGAQLVYQVQVAGVWYSLDDTSSPSSVFIGLPPLLPFRVVFIGSDSVQAALGVASNSRVTTWRSAPTMVHISKRRTMPSPVTRITLDVRLESWRGSPYHSFAAKLLTGGPNVDTTVTNPGTTTEEPAPDDPVSTIIRHYTWTVAATSVFRFRMEGTTDNKLATFHVAERLDVDTP